MARLCGLLLVTLVIAALGACSAQTAEPTPVAVAPAATDTPLPPTPTSTPTPKPTETRKPTATAAPSATPTPTLTPSPAPTPTPTNTSVPMATNIAYQPAFGVDYVHPEQYLVPGEQSRISDPSVLDGLRVQQQSLEHLGDIYRWLKGEFTAYSAGGKTIGLVTVDDLLAERRLGGCHDHALVYAAVARDLGYPAIIARANSIAWVERSVTCSWRSIWMAGGCSSTPPTAGT
jgi:hypothetical protein